MRGRIGRWGWALASGAVFLAALVFWFGREVGGFEAAATIRSLESQLADLDGRTATVERERAQAEQHLAEERTAAARRIALLQTQVPQGEFAGLVELLRDKAAAGVTLERLRFVLAQAGTQRSCRDGLTKRRLTPRLPDDLDPLQTVAFLDNRITISADGRRVATDGDRPHGGFDPQAPVDIRLLRIGGAVEHVQGTLPLGHSIVADEREYRFGFASSAKSPTIEITLQDCAYP